MPEPIAPGGESKREPDAPTRTLDVLQLAQMVRHYRAQLYAITKIKTNDAQVLRRVALDALKSEPSHHVWCGVPDLYAPRDCPQCPELWERFPDVQEEAGGSK
jgi:hypothetical protein